MWQVCFLVYLLALNRISDMNGMAQDLNVWYPKQTKIKFHWAENECFVTYYKNCFECHCWSHWKHRRVTHRLSSMSVSTMVLLARIEHPWANLCCRTMEQLQIHWSYRSIVRGMGCTDTRSCLKIDEAFWTDFSLTLKRMYWRPNWRYCVVLFKLRENFREKEKKKDEAKMNDSRVPSCFAWGSVL